MRDVAGLDPQFDGCSHARPEVEQASGCDLDRIILPIELQSPAYFSRTEQRQTLEHAVVSTNDVLSGAIQRPPRDDARFCRDAILLRWCLLDLQEVVVDGRRR